MRHGAPRKSCGKSGHSVICILSVLSISSLHARAAHTAVVAGHHCVKAVRLDNMPYDEFLQVGIVQPEGVVGLRGCADLHSVGFLQGAVEVVPGLFYYMAISPTHTINSSLAAARSVCYTVDHELVSPAGVHGCARRAGQGLNRRAHCRYTSRSTQTLVL